jgi:hypothetical protein
LFRHFHEVAPGLNQEDSPAHTGRPSCRTAPKEKRIAETKPALDASAKRHNRTEPGPTLPKRERAVQVLPRLFKSPKAQVRGLSRSKYRTLHASIGLLCGRDSATVMPGLYSLTVHLETTARPESRRAALSLHQRVLDCHCRPASTGEPSAASYSRRPHRSGGWVSARSVVIASFRPLPAYRFDAPDSLARLGGLEPQSVATRPLGLTPTLAASQLPSGASLTILL